MPDLVKKWREQHPYLSALEDEINADYNSQKYQQEKQNEQYEQQRKEYEQWVQANQYGPYGDERDQAAPRGVSNALTPEMEYRHQQASGGGNRLTPYQVAMQAEMASAPTAPETRSNTELRRDANRQTMLAAGTTRMAADMGNQLTQDQSLIFNPTYTSNLRTMGQTMEAQQNKAAQAQAHYQTVKEQRKAEEAWSKYSPFLENPDFIEKSKPDLSNENRVYYSMAHSKEAIEENGANVNAAAYATDDEKRLYYYLWNTKGSSAANAYYYNYVEHAASARKAVDVELRTAARVQNNGFLGDVRDSFKSIGTNAISGIGIIDIAFQNIGAEVSNLLGLGDPGINYYSLAQMPGIVTDAIRSNVAKKIAESTPGLTIGKAENAVNVASFLYETGMSMADSTAMVLMNLAGVPEWLTLANMGTAAGTRAVRDAKERGASDWQALAFGISSAVMEALFEKASLDSILKPSDGKFFKNAAKQTFVEGSEEFFTTWGNTMMDQIIMGDKSELFTRERQLMEQGYSQKDALNKAALEWCTQIGADALAGMISGFGMGGAKEVGTGLGIFAQGVRQDVQTARALTDYQNAQRQAAPQQDKESTIVNDNPAQHTKAEQKIIDEYKNSTDNNLLDAFNTYYENRQAPFSRHKISNVSQRQAADASRILGGDYSGFTNNINKNGINHIIDEHGPQGRVDHSMADLNDAARIGYVLDNYDTVEQAVYDRTGEPDTSAEFRDRNNRPAPMLKYSKKVNGTYYVVEAVPDTNYKKFWVVGAYMGNNSAESLTQAPDAQGPRNTPEASLPSQLSANENVPQAGNTVKGGTTLRVKENPPPVPRQQAPLTIRSANATVEENRQEESYGQGQQTETAAAAGEDDFRARAETAAEGARRSYLDRIERSSGLGRVLQDLRNYRIVRGAESRASEVARIRNQAEAGNQRDVSAQDYSIANGSTEQSAKELDSATASKVLGRNWDRAVAELSREGVTLKAMTGQLMKEDGSQVRAFFSGDGKTIVVQVDHPKLSWNQLLDHEDLHRRIKENPAYRKAVEDALLADKKLQAYLPEIIDRYSRAYAEHAPGLTSDDVIEELLADYRAGFDMLDPLGMNPVTARAAKRTARDIRAVERKGVEKGRYKTNGGKPAPEGKASTEIDTDYLAAVDSDDMETAQRMVDEAAKKAGYTTPKLYHGTRAFGFTEFDTSKSDDGISLFVTDNPKTAQTYSGETQRNRINEASRVDVDSLSGEQLLEEAKKQPRLKRYQDYHVMSDDTRQKLIDEDRRGLAISENDAKDFLNKHRAGFGEDGAAAVSRFIEALSELRKAKTEDQLDAAFDKLNGELWDIKWMSEDNGSDIAYDFMDEIGWRQIQAMKNRLSDFMYSGDIFIDKDEYGYVFDNQIALELDAELHKGVYELYGKPGRQLVINADGANWNQITPPEELNLYGPQKTRDIATAAKANGYDSVLFKGLRDNGGETAYNGESDVYIFFNPESLKSADPVTYDGKGKPIPLSERYDTKKQDIRYSREMDHEAYSGKQLSTDPDLYTYAFLTARSPMTVTVLPDLDTLRDGKKVRSGKVVAAGMENAGEIGAERDGKIYVKNDYTDRELRIDVAAIRHGLNGEQNRLITNARMGAVIGEMVQHGIPINALENKAEGVTGTYAMASYAYDQRGREFIGIITVEQRSGDVDGVALYDVTHSISGRQKNGQKNSNQAGTKPQGVYPIKVADISIAQLLDIVNSTHQSILSDDVLEALGETRNPSGEYTNKAKFSVEIDPEVAAQFSPEAIALRQAKRNKGVKGERKVSRVRSNTYEYSGLFNEVEAQMDGADEENYTYDPVSEKKSMNEALGRLKADFDGEVSRLSEADKQWGGSDLDTAMGILHRYRTEGRETGDYSRFWDWSKTIQEKGTKGGQFIQAFAKYTRTGTGAAMKGAKDIHDRFKLNPAQQKQVDAAKKKLMDGIEKEYDGAASDAMKQAKGQKEPGKKKDERKYTEKDKKKLDAETQRRKDAERLVQEIGRLFNQKQQQDHGEPVENWLKLTGEELARKIAGRFSEPKQRTKTTMQTILGDLVGFAEEHALPERKKAEGEKRTAIDTITDYLANRDAYGTAWAAAQSYLRAAYTDDQEKLDALNSFLTATIAYNAEGTDRTMLDAILQSADVLGISEKRILELTSAGATSSTIDRIGDELVSQVKERMGADYDESFTQQLKDAVRRHITGIALQESAEDQRLRLGGMTTDAARQLDMNLQKLLTQSRGDKNKAAQSVADYLIRELDIPSSDAAIAADRITSAFMDELASRADRKLQQMFAEKKPKTQEQRDRLLDLIRLGGLTNSNVEDAVVDALGIGGLSRERQRELVGAMAQFGETLDAMEADDAEGLRQLIREQAAVRGTRLSRLSEKTLSGETDIEYLRDFALAQLASIAGDFENRSAGEMISTYQTISHLLNMRTALRNVTSNQVFDLIDSAANNMSLLPDIALSLMTGKRTVGLNKSWASQQKRQGAVQGARRNALEVNLDVGVDDRQKSKYGTAGRRTWAMASSRTAGKILSHLEEVMGYELNTTDEFHKGSVMGETLDSLSRFVDRGDMTLEEAQEFATEMALYRSFQDDSLIGTMLSSIKDALNLAGVGEQNGKQLKSKKVHDFGLGDFVTKYTQVPGALVHRAIEFSPLGYAKALFNLGQLANARRQGYETNAAQRKAALAIGRATTGTGLITFFAALAKAGLLRRDEDEDKNAKAAHQAQGLNGTQLNLTALGRKIEGGSAEPEDGDILIDINFLEPLDALMGLATLVANEDERNLESIWNDSITAVWDSISSLSMMQTLRDAYNVYQYYDDKAEDKMPLMNQMLLEIASSSLSGFIPSPVRQLAQATDTTYRDQYRSKKISDQMRDKAKNSIPGLRQTLAPKITPLGEDKKYEKPLLNYLNATLNPGNISVYKSNKIVSELERVYDETENANIWPERNAPYSFTVNKEKYTLTPDERTQYQRTRGQETAKFIEDVMGASWYKSMSPDSQAKILNDVGNFANYIAKKEMLDARGVEYASDDYQKLLDMYLGGATPADVMKEANRKLAGLIDAGLTEDQAKEAKSISKAEDKREFIQNQTELTDDEKLAALGVMIGTDMVTENGNPTQWANINTAVKDGMSVDSVLDMVNNDTLDDYMHWRDSDVKKAGIKADDYITFVLKYNSLKSERDANGKEIKGQKKQDKVTAYINSLKITAAQKDALYLDKYKEAKLGDTPWHGGSMGEGATYARARTPALRLPDVPKATKPSSGLRLPATNTAPRQSSGLRLK